jgi:3-hydroxyacyl-CoA dehydrogenase
VEAVFNTDVKKVVVLGAGTMGAQVAAHVVAQGLDVALLDLPGTGSDRSAAARRGIESLRKLKPSPLHLPEHAALLRPGNFDDDLAREAKDADWIVEAVVEDLEVKKRLLARVAPLAASAAVVTASASRG